MKACDVVVRRLPFGDMEGVQKVVAYSLALLAATLGLTSCGGGGGSAEPPPTVIAPATTSGRVIDGYLSGAVVFWDCNSNGEPDVGEDAVRTNASGAFAIPNGNVSGRCRLAAKVTPDTIDSDTGKATGTEYTMYPLVSDLSKQAAVNITPLTTLVATSALWTNERDAEAALAERLGIELPSNTDALTSTTDARYVHQANVNRVVARLLQVRNSATLTVGVSAAETSEVLLSAAAKISKALPTDRAAQPSELTYLNWLTSPSETLIARYLGGTSKVEIRRPSGLSSDQLAYLSTLLATDPEVVRNTALGRVLWHRLPSTKLASINARLRALGFYSDADPRVLDMRQARAHVLDELRTGFNIELSTKAGANVYGENWIFSAGDALVYSVRGAFRTATPGDLIVLVNGSQKAAFGVLKVYYGVPGPEAVASFVASGSRDPLRAYEVFSTAFKVADRTLSSAACIADLDASYARFQRLPFSSWPPAELEGFFGKIVTCAGEVFDSNLAKILGGSAEADASRRSAEIFAMVKAAGEAVNAGLGLLAFSPAANRISGLMDILLAGADSMEVGMRWDKLNPANAEMDVLAEQITDQYNKGVNAIIRQTAAAETSLAVDAYIVPAGSQSSQVPICTAPFVQQSGTCVPELPKYSVRQVTVVGGVNQAVEVLIESAGAGLLPKASYIAIEGARCGAPFARELLSFRQLCQATKALSSTVTFSDGAGSTEVIGTATFKASASAAPVISALTAGQKADSVEIYFNVADADSLALRTVRAELSRAGSAAANCWKDSASLAPGQKSVVISPATAPGCALILKESSNALKVSVSAVDETGNSAVPLSRDIVYSVTPSTQDAFPVFLESTLPTSIKLGESAAVSGSALDDVGLVAVGMEVGQRIVLSVSVSAKSVPLSSLVFDSKNANYAGAPGIYPVTVFARDTRGQVLRRTYLLEVLAPANNQAPSIASAFATQNTDGSLTVTFTASDPEGGTVGADLYISNAGGTTFNASSKKTLAAAASGTGRSVTWSKAEADSFMSGGQTYAVRVDAFDSAGAQTQRTTNSFTRAIPANQPPTFSSAVATQNTDGSLTVTFTASDPEGGTVGADLYISNAGGTTFNASSKKTLAAAASGTGRSVTWSKAEADSFMSGGQTYAVRVDAFDSAGAQTQRTTNSFTRAIPANQPPTFSSAVATQNTDGSLTVTFTASDPEGGTVGADLYISNAGGTTFNASSKKTLAAAASGTGRSVTWSKAEADSFMSGGQTYAVRVDAFDSAGAQTQRTTNSFTRAIPANQPPTFSSAVATQNTDGSLTVTFTASDPEGGTVGADLYISNAGGTTFNASSKKTLAAAASGTGRSVTWSKAEADSFMSGGQTYAVRVDAFDSAGAQTQRTTNSFTRAIPANQPPTFSSAVATQNTDGSLTVTFTASDPEGGTVGADLYISNAGGTTFNASSKKTLAAAASGTGRSVTWSKAEADSFMSGGQTYAVRVDAFDSAGAQTQRTTNSFTRAIPANQPPTFSSAVATQNTDGSLTVTFTASDPEGGTVGADLYISNAGGTTFNASSKKTLAAAASGTGRSVTWSKAEADSFMSGGQTYAVRVDAFDSSAAQTQRVTNSFTRTTAVTVPSTPTGAAPGNTTATGPLLGSGATFHWDASSGASEYEVVFFDVASNVTALTFRISSTSFLLGTYNLTGGSRVYSWRVAACNIAGCSAYTSELRFRRQ